MLDFYSILLEVWREDRSAICFFVNVPATTDMYTYSHTLSLHDALPNSPLHVDDHLRGNAVPAPLSRPRQRPTTLSNPLSDQRACCRHLPLHRSRRHSPGTRRTKVRSAHRREPEVIAN